MEEVEIIASSEVLSATLFESSKSHKTVLILASATGVKQQYYHKFAQFIADHGISVITFDYLGIGRSLRKPIRELENNAADWGTNDLEAVIQFAIANYPQSRKVILGHSIGGQLIGLAKSSTRVDKIILVAAQSGYWKLWPGLSKISMWLNWNLLFPSLLHTFGYLKSKRFTGMEDLPKNVAKQWANWGQQKEYLLGDRSIGKTYFEEITKELTVFSIDDDDFAPKEAVEWMADAYRNAKRKSFHLQPIDFQVESIGHFGVFKTKFKETIWARLLIEIA